MPFSREVLARLDVDADEIIGKYPGSRSALLPLLHLVQAEEGYVSADGIGFCAGKLGLTETDVTGVVSFYTMYKRRPVGQYHVGVCTNTVCGVLGGNQILAELREHLGVGDDEATPDGQVSLEHLECNAACEYAPVMMVNWEFFDNMTPQSARQLADDLRAGNQVTPTRGPGRLVTWREAGRILAGFNDGLATEGPAAGPADLVGLNIAREHDWTAPQPARDADGTADGTSANADGTSGNGAAAQAEAESPAGSGSAGSAGSGASPADSASPTVGKTPDPDHAPGTGKSPEPGQGPEAGQTPRPRSSARSRSAEAKRPPASTGSADSEASGSAGSEASEASESSQPEQESP